MLACPLWASGGIVLLNTRPGVSAGGPCLLLSPPCPRLPSQRRGAPEAPQARAHQDGSCPPRQRLPLLATASLPVAPVGYDHLHIRRTWPSSDLVPAAWAPRLRALDWPLVVSSALPQRGNHRT